MLHEAIFAAIGLAGLAKGQQAGTVTPEVHPKLPMSQCTASGCTTLNTEITLDSNWRWLHTTSGYTNCYTGNTFDRSICSSASACAANCAVDGADYPGTYGIRASGNALTLGFKTGSNVGSRNYLMDPSGTAYKVFKLKNKEFTFDVDVSNLPCGVNGALYFAEMPANGGASPAGAKYGTGYCDAQCPRDLKFVNGVANSDSWTPSNGDPNSGTGRLGACCAEMDIWEANSISNAYTPHPCQGSGLQTCTSDQQCGAEPYRYEGLCDRDGCDFNPYRAGNTSFYGPGKTIDTRQKMTVITQFITTDGTDNGQLKEIRRIYKQGNRVIQNSVSDLQGVDDSNSLTDKFCTQQKTLFGDNQDFARKGGMAKMGDAMGRGMVLVMSIWDDHYASMLWLDGTYPIGGSGPGVVRGTCDSTSGLPKNVEANFPGSSVTFSNIKFGTIGSTYTK
ncbi:putative 1,4-beta-D-glucan cellobiohydrolase A [Cercospora beticola]|uniref:Glucanase n=1 Tax=Cercospora beticola TaxID=122368 RepID=A0A2G5HDY8_CERBT|nr:putative 1,4-beta-D-glucan cellobiohydrolase A [Cercospora beticola]PIA90764.1 putative 1,4-beta-D-glucan cellobiohydrolase A [Cercospora beticola]WPB07730.1 hypothetical protein RHO25_012392 [Cercospora beticola]